MTTENATTEPTEKRARPARIERLVSLATDAFEKHEIRSRTETSVVIQRRNDDNSWSNHYATEIVAGGLAHLIVTGDIDTVVFARQSGSLRSRLGWIAPKAERDRSAIRSSASSAANSVESLRSHVMPIVAFSTRYRHDGSTTLAQDAEAEGDDARAAALREIDPPSDESKIGAFLEALEDAGISDVWEYWSSLHEVAPRVVYAWAACRKAAELIDAADADAAAQEAAREATKASRKSWRAAPRSRPRTRKRASEATMAEGSPTFGAFVREVLTQARKLDALDSREAWEVVVDAVCDTIPEAAPPHVCEESPDELLVKGDPAHEEFAADAVLRAELHDEARERFESLSRALEARGFAIVRVR